MEGSHSYSTGWFATSQLITNDLLCFAQLPHGGAEGNCEYRVTAGFATLFLLPIHCYDFPQVV